jgi:hypothetical protein
MQYARQALVCAVALLCTVTTLVAEDCGEWEVLPSPNPGSSGNALRDIAAPSAGSAWAVGSAGVGAPFAMEHDGASWNLVTLPNTGSLGTMPDLATVTAASNDDVWAFGNVTTTYPTYNMPLAIRWRNNTWDRVETITLAPQTVYPYAARGGLFYASHAAAPDHVWAVGTAAGFGDGGATSVALAARFNGSSWTETPTPIVANRTHRLAAVHALAPNNVWSVGYTRNIAGTYHALTLRYNGSSWMHVPNPGEGIPQSFLYALAVIASDNIYAAGSINYSSPLLMHWNGSSWSIVPLDSVVTSGEIVALAVTDSNEVWGSLGSQANLLHFDGETWSLRAAPPIPAGQSWRSVRSLAAVEGAAGACELWAAGTSYDASNVGSTYTARPQALAPTPPGDLNGDGSVDVFDLLVLLGAWGQCGSCAQCAADLNGDCVVDVFDMLILLGNWS